MKSNYLIDVPVALIFFNRPKPLKEVFDAIRKTKPSKIFLIQDGARDGNVEDKINIEKCRSIVSEIDWQCEVFEDFSLVNLGCGLRVYSGVSKAFEKVDRLCIIEDDCVASNDFFFFAKEMLDRYVDDPRVDMISGMNNLEVHNKTPYSYFFASTGSIWGWATWKRSWKNIDYNFSFMDDQDACRLLLNKFKRDNIPTKFLNSARERREILVNGGRLTAWSLQRGINMYLHSGLIIIPKYNLVKNVGLTSDSTHAVDSINKLPIALRQLFFMKIYKIDFPLLHPKYIIDDVEFNHELNKIMNPNLLINFTRRVEGFIRRNIFQRDFFK